MSENIERKNGKLTVTSEPFMKFPLSTSKKKRKFVCVTCDCGNTREYTLSKLKRKEIVSCGCYRRSGMNYRHGLVNHSLYTVHQSMFQRCHDKNCKAYKNYGGRGITICNEWKDFKTFFDWAIFNGWEQGLQLDRRNNNGNYEPSNCHFTTSTENNRNKRNIVLTIEKANEIRALNGVHSRKDLSIMFNTSKGNIGHVLKNETWINA